MKEKQKYYILIITILFLLLPRSVRALDVRDFTFLHFGEHEGLSSQHVYSLCQGPEGAVWWTTKNGVDRSNGSIVCNYKVISRNKQHVVSGRFMKFVHGNGKLPGLYVFDNFGSIFIYNKVQNRFDELVDISQQIKGISLSDVFYSDNAFWLATQKGVFRLDKSGEGKLTPVFCNHAVNFIQSAGSNLLFCAIDYVFSYSLKKKGAPRAWLPLCVFSCYYDEANGKLWLGTFFQGVKVVNMKDPHYSMSTVNVPICPVRTIRPYGNGRILIGIDGCGVYEASRNGTDAKVLFTANNGIEGVLHGNGIYDILVDAWNDIFIGSYSGGVDIARPNESTTAIFRHIDNSMQSLGNNHVNCVAQAGTNRLVMGTDDGISIFDTQMSKWTQTARGKVVLDICKKPGGGFLLATYGNGVWEMSADGNARNLYSRTEGTLNDDYVYAVAYDKTGNLWIGTLFGSVTVNTKDGKRNFDINNVVTMCPLDDGRMAIGTSHGLYIVGANDQNARELKYMSVKSDAAKSIVVSLCLTPDNRLWIGTDGGGVHVYNLRTKKTVQITTVNGLPSDCVNSLVYDGHGRIWFGTEKGLAFSYINDPKRVANESFCYGLNTEFCHSAVTNLLNGDILYGTVNGAIIVRPTMMSPLDYKAPLNIRGIRLHLAEGYLADNASLSSDDDFNEQIASGLAEGVINLNYDQRNFDIYFEAIHLRNQYDIGYQYRLGDMSWSPTTSQQFISFSNLEPGEHELHIRSVSKTSGKVLDEKTITINVAHPWWNSWWMWCVYILVLVVAFRGALWMYTIHNRYMRLMAERVGVSSDVIVNIATDKVASVSEDFSESSGTSALVDSKETTESQVVFTELSGPVKSTDTSNSSVSTEENDEGSDFISQATKFVLQNLSNTDFTMDDLAVEMGMSRTLFYVKVKTYTGRSPLDFVRAIRLERAGALLKAGHSVTEVSTLTGFDNPKYFSTVFKKYFGVSPSKFE